MVLTATIDGHSAQVLLGLAADAESRRRICSSGCLPALFARMFDRICGVSVHRVLVKLSLDEATASAVLSCSGAVDPLDDEGFGVLDALEEGVRGGQLTYEAAVLLANLSRFQQCDGERVCAIVLHALRTPIGQKRVATDREAMEDERPTVGPQHLLMYEVLCMAASNALRHTCSSEQVLALVPALARLDRQHRDLQGSARWNEALLGAVWNASVHSASCPADGLDFLRPHADRPVGRQFLSTLASKRDAMTATQAALIPLVVQEILERVRRS